MIEYAIRDIVEFAKKLESTGRKVTYLNIGDPVKFDFDTPTHVKQALYDAVESGENYYGSSEGLLELRQAICQKEKRVNKLSLDPEDVIVTTGVSEAIFMIIAAIVGEGDEILLPGPTYPPYASYTKFFEGEPVAYRTIEEEGWKPDLEDISSKISKKTKGIVVINPNNPTGAVYDVDVIQGLIDVASENDLVVLSDEIYDRIVYEERFSSTSYVAKDFPVIGLNGFSKTYLATGWRLGYLYFHDPEGQLEELKQNVKKESRIRLCTNTPVQKAGVAALEGPQEHIGEMVRRLRVRRDYAWKRLDEMKGINCIKPKGAFYLFPRVEEIGKRWQTDFDFVLEALEKTSVLLVHGSGFGDTYGSAHFRSVFLPPIAVLEDAFNKLERFMVS